MWGYKHPYTCMYPYIPMHAFRQRPPKPEFSRPGANPTLQTIEFVRAALMAAEVPVSRNDLLAQLGIWGRSTTRQSLNAALAFLAADGSVAEGSKGLLWVRPATGTVLDAIRGGPRL